MGDIYILPPQIEEPSEETVVELMIFGEITESSSYGFYEEFRQAERDDEVDTIRLVINSPGGEVAGLKMMLSLIDNSPKTVKTIGIGTIASCGLLLLASGNHRSAYRDADLMSHNIDGGVAGTPSQIKVALDQYKKVDNYFRTKYGEYTGLSRKDVDKELFREVDRWMTAEEAFKLNLIDEII